jgi:hypothetical protein
MLTSHQKSWPIVVCSFDSFAAAKGLKEQKKGRKGGCSELAGSSYASPLPRTLAITRHIGEGIA